MPPAAGFAERRGSRRLPQPLLPPFLAAPGERYSLKSVLKVDKNPISVEREEDEEEESTEESDQERDVATSRRRWALDNLYSVVSTNASMDPLVLERFLLTLCCTEIDEEKEEEEQSKTDVSQCDFLHADFLSDLKSFCQPALSEAIRSHAQSLLFAVLRSLAQKTEDGSQAGVSKEKELYVYLVLQEYQRLEARIRSTEGVSLVHEWDEGETEVRSKLLASVEKLVEKIKKENSKQEVMFTNLLINIAIEQIFKPEYSQFIPDVLECYEQFSATKRRDDERPIAVLLEVVLILLRTSSKVLRDNAVKLFGGLSEDLKEEDVNDMLQVFWTNESLEEEEKESGDGEEENEEMEIEISEDENENENEVKEEEEEENEEEEEEESEEIESSEENESSEKKEAGPEEDSDVDWDQEVFILPFLDL